MEDSGWGIDEINSMTIYFHKTTVMNGSSYVKIPLRSSATLNVENDDKYCFLWSISAGLHPRNKSHPNRVTKYTQCFDELNIEGFDFSKRFKCTDMHRFEKLNNLSINIFELSFYQDQIKWRHKLLPIEISKNESERVLDLLIHKNHYVFNKN